MKLILTTLVLFLIAALFEIGGGYLVWQWIREKKNFFIGVAGGVILFIYGIIPTLQPTNNFGRIYAAYGGVFIISSILWGAIVDKRRPDKYEIVGSIISLIGVFVIFYIPR